MIPPVAATDWLYGKFITPAASELVLIVRQPGNTLPLRGVLEEVWANTGTWVVVLNGAKVTVPVMACACAVLSPEKETETGTV